MTPNATTTVFRTVDSVVGWLDPEHVDLKFDTAYCDSPLLKILHLGIRDDMRMVYRDSVIQRAVVRKTKIGTV